jgi:FMN phosphatase YigB (HAD superfamily)
MRRVPSFRAVVTDLDNTLYPWVDYIVPSLEAMVASLERTTGLPRVRIVQSLKAVYERHGSNEYPWAIQESDLFRPYEADFDSFNALVLDPARRAFKAARDRYLRPYPGVRETLDRVRARGIRVVGLTDAPRNAAELRLKHLKLDGHFDALYSLPGYAVPERVDPEIRRKEDEGQYRSRTPVVELPREAEKPSADGLRRILEDLGAAAEAVLYVGDNVKKDMPVAAACGAVGVWAEYGTYVSGEYRERLAVISPKSITRRHVAEETPARWPLAISSFTQVLDILDGARWVGPERGAEDPPAVRGGAPARAGRSGPARVRAARRSR